MDNDSVITAVTDIAHPPEEVWRVLTDFAAYAQWHPGLHFVDVPDEIRPGTQLRVQVISDSEAGGEHIFTVVHYEAPRRFVWQGGIPDVLMALHSFVLEPHGSGTRLTESEEITGPAAAQFLGPGRSETEERYASYGRALAQQIEAGH
ncbi:SRPBCC domain-containing protein [Streptomyces sp. BV286]|uniref:SRPBCC domain-containing protein n=1 Tax=Streptomyces sp. BV286 TaxID=2849672 RepID=UPI001C2E71E4|nr:SRPBCC domain-containing protein [Streptomyces sp. BV286]MBV1940438.1 SRPBCC domain-containing protein [Streptomyces sp. BV286]